MLLWSLLPALLLVVPAWAELCPGGKVKCPNNMTCCPLANHEFGCCTYPQAQCCHDHVHCCPFGMKCDERHQACLKNGFPVLFFAQISARPEVVVQEEEEEGELTYYHHIHFLETNHVNDTDVEGESKNCPDGHQCPSSFTCCKMFRGHYGCCPYADAKCCMDGFHCCPHGSECEPTSGGCESERGAWLGKAAAMMKTSEPRKPSPPQAADPGGKCPDGHPCAEQFTCCHVTDGGYGCCPLTDAICCTDLIHCCPQHSVCNTSTGACDKGNLSTPAFSLASQNLPNTPHFPETLPETESELSKAGPDGLCPDKQSRCEPGNTCCLMKDGSYGCCPFAEATCCSDHESCCPNGYQCAAGGMCERLPFLSFLPPVLRQHKPAAVPSEEPAAVDEEYINCPDGSMCPDGNTCCNISSSRFGCCPMPRATCCGDMQHCCPHGYWCADSGCERLEGGSSLNKTLIEHTTLGAESPKVMLAP